jgi:hypothetical protein
VARNNFNELREVTHIYQTVSTTYRFTKFTDRPYFEAAEGTEVAPEGEFDHIKMKVLNLLHPRSAGSYVWAIGEAEHAVR